MNYPWKGSIWNVGGSRFGKYEKTLGDPRRQTFFMTLCTKITMTKITNVEIHQLGQEVSSATWASSAILVKLVTDDGNVGWGEAVPTLRVQPVIQSLKEVARVYVGKDPFNVERNRREWYKHDFYLARSFESTTALSAVDIACWDLIGKYFGTPLYRLLGGRTRERVRLYANGWYNGAITPEEFAAKARDVVRKGYTGLKFDPFGPHFDYITLKGLRIAEERVRAVREAVGEGVDIMIEHHGRFNPNSAIMVAKVLEKYDPLFMEEPVHPENIEGLMKYRRETSVRVALGERIISKEDALLYLKNDLVDFLQVDLTNVGGITEAKKVTGIAEAFGVEMAYHNAFGPVQNAATLHLASAISNFLIQESFYDFFPQWKRDLVGDVTPVESGYSKPPERPGLGVEIKEDILEKYKAQGMEYFNPNEPVWVVNGTWAE